MSDNIQTGNEPEARLTAVVDKLQQASGQKIEVAYVDIEQPLAAAASDGVLITRGFIECTRNDDELAFTVAHEFGHVEHNDTERRSVAKKEILERAAEICENHRGGAIKNLLLLGGALAVVYLSDKKVNRDREREADDRAAELATKAGFDAVKGAEIVRRTGNHRTVLEQLKASHPAGYERAANVRNKVNR